MKAIMYKINHSTLTLTIACLLAGRAGKLNLNLNLNLNYSHSMVAGGLLLMSYTTRLMPFTLLMISLLMWAKNS